MTDAAPVTTGARVVVHATDEPSGPRIGAEGLDVYRLALEFQLHAVDLVPRGQANLRDQLERASVSIALNIAEGAGRRSPADKARFYSMARGSATESAAILDILRLRRITPLEQCSRGRRLLVRIVQMLTRLEAATRVFPLQ